jgi:Chaperone of endosialidase
MKGRTMNPMIQLKKPTPLIVTVLSLACFGLAQAVVPPPDGGYPGNNTAEGQRALFSVTTGINNTAVGSNALYFNTTGNNNTANGFAALFRNTTGSNNAAAGLHALYSNTTGSNNTANGGQALFKNTTGSSNTADGVNALYYNTTGIQNTANGADALRFNTTGGGNTANGYQALVHNTTGSNNTANGAAALYHDGTGSSNTVIGTAALYNSMGNNDNTAIGSGALLLLAFGSGNIALGAGAGGSVRLSDNNIFIGSQGDFFDYSDTIRIGASQTRTFVAGIRGATTANTDAIPVLIDSAGQLGTASSSARFKKDVKPMDNASESILALKPVTFHYKTDKTSTPQFGLIAEEVAKVNPALVLPDKEAKPYTVRYDAVNAMLLNEFIKEHRKNEKQEATIARLEKQIEVLTVGLQKVSAQLELSKSAPQTVLNNQ